MATKNEIAEAKNEERVEERVDVFIPRQVGGDANYFVSVNGVNYLLPRGKTSSVPKHIAEEIKRSMKAEDRYEEAKARLAEAVN